MIASENLHDFTKSKLSKFLVTIAADLTDASDWVIGGLPSSPDGAWAAWSMDSCCGVWIASSKGRGIYFGEHLVYNDAILWQLRFWCFLLFPFPLFFSIPLHLHFLIPAVISNKVKCIIYTPVWGSGDESEIRQWIFLRHWHSLMVEHVFLRIERVSSGYFVTK